jgi:hypothetical protein
MIFGKTKDECFSVRGWTRRRTWNPKKRSDLPVGRSSFSRMGRAQRTPSLTSARDTDGFRCALPILIWGFVSQGLRTGVDWVLAVRGRRAEPCVAQRADRAPGEDWLPKIAAARCITSYPVGPNVRTHIPHACGEEAMRMRPFYEAAGSALGWHGHHPSSSGGGGEAATRPCEVSVMLSWLPHQEQARL